MGLAMRQADLERLDRALTTILSPLAYQRCDDWRLAVESSVAELLDGDHVVFGLPRAGVPMHVHSMNVAGKPQRAIQAFFGRLPDLPSDPWLQEAERERLRSGAEVWSRCRAFWRVATGRPGALRRSPFIGEILTPVVAQDRGEVLLAGDRRRRRRGRGTRLVRTVRYSCGGCGVGRTGLPARGEQPDAEQHDQHGAQRTAGGVHASDLPRQTSDPPRRSVPPTANGRQERRKPTERTRAQPVRSSASIAAQVDRSMRYGA